MGKTKTIPWDIQDHLKTPEERAGFLEAVLELALENADAGLVAAALGDIAKAKGMTQVAQESGLARESLYRALSRDGNPELATFLKVIRALGIRLQAVPVEDARVIRMVRDARAES